jgi:hypothetical protein
VDSRRVLCLAGSTAVANRVCSNSLEKRSKWGRNRKSFGTGETKVFKGKITVIAAVTPVLDRYYTIFNVLGERFLQLRWHRPHSEEAGTWAIRQQGNEATILKQLRRAVEAVFDSSSTTAPTLSGKTEVRLSNMAEFTAIGRTHVLRSSFGNREIEYVPEPEANTRIAKGLAAVARGIAALQGRSAVAEQDIQDALRVGIDCLPMNRRRLLLAIAKGQNPETVQLPATVRTRELDELEALQLLTPSSDYALTEKASRLLSVADVMLGGMPILQ